MTTVTVSDEVLLAQLRAGDTAVLEPLMERFSGRLFRVAQGITRSASDAEEVIQDVFLSLLNKRRGKRAQLEVLIEDHLPTFKEDGHREGDRAFLLADWSDLPDETLLSKEGRETIRAAIDRLPAQYRAVLVLRDVEELSTEDVAEALGATVASVKSRLHRARMALREMLTVAYTATPH